MEPLLENLARHLRGLKVPTAQRQLWHPITAFFAANYQVLNATQRDVLEHILHEYHPEHIASGALPDTERLYDAIAILSREANRLEFEGWERKVEGESDNVRGPNHYMRNPIEPTFFNMELGLNWLLGNAVKYTVRYEFKNGPEDLRKAARNIEMYARWSAGETSWSR